jgi:hypothetical protein
MGNGKAIAVSSISSNGFMPAACGHSFAAAGALQRRRQRRVRTLLDTRRLSIEGDTELTAAGATYDESPHQTGS